MSSYFVNSFSGRYPNGSDYQLLNYGTNGAVSGSFRDPGTMHSGSFGYNYNGMDLTVNRTNTGSHFGAVREDARGFAPDARYRQTPNCSLSSPDPVPPSCATASREPLELKSPSPPSDRSSTSSGNNLNKSNNAHFTEIEDATVASETEEGAHSSGGSSTAPRAQQQQQQQQDPNATSSTNTSNDCQSPQIFPWMRKLHISHDMTGPDGKRARTAYTRYQTLELEKEFHFNRCFNLSSLL
ncbi:homeobox protein Hox-B5b isoform X2 [Epinephelus fuscoguttatus]|uniref:homeobox protein Hox-B5b isoform X2 n=1 Tax=Epinephelus fuscoguttatus TaxID=293821 RepID=UPI0020D173FD|nr:homeobox protein Hox-B5b isoform X2 [Epinephelus fuscoguttatus]